MKQRRRWIERHCVKSIRIRSYSGPHFPAFELNTGKCGPEQLRKQTLSRSERERNVWDY